MKRLSILILLLGSINAYPQDLDYFVEQFVGSGDDTDLSNLTLTFTPADSDSLYEACTNTDVLAFPVSPSGHTTVSLGNDTFVDTGTFGGEKTFPFYSIPYTNVFIGSNGYLTLGSGDNRVIELLADHFSLPRITGFAKDLDPSSGGTVSWAVLEDSFVVTYENVIEAGTTNQFSFQIQLFFEGESNPGMIKITWLSLGSLTGIAGLSNGNGLPESFSESNLNAYPVCGTIKLRVQPDVDYTTSGTAGNSGSFSPLSSIYTLENLDSENGITWTSAISSNWVNAEPSSGSLTPSGTVDVNLTYNASELSSLGAGTHNTFITFYPNPGSPVMRKVTATITEGSGGITQFFTEWFDSQDFDLGNSSISFEPGTVAEHYVPCRETNVTEFPTDPTGGNPVSLADDDFFQITLTGGNKVALYGTSYSDFYVNSNGLFTIGTGTTTYTESTTEHFTRPTISPLFRDFNPATGGTISWKELSDRVAVTFQGLPEVQFSNSNPSHPSNANTFQVEWFFDTSSTPGKIKITWLQIDAGNGIVGLSQGQGIPTGFSESDLSALTCDTPTPQIDWGDAPDTAAGTGSGNYKTHKTDEGPSHIITQDLFIGQGAPDAEPDAHATADAKGDDQAANPDEDGIFDAADLKILAGTSGPIVRVSVTNNKSATATLNGWIDYNGDGAFGNSSEKGSVTVPDNSGAQVYNLTFPAVPANAVAMTSSQTFLRLRLSTDSAANDSTGAASDGEVEDHRVTVLDPPVASVSLTAQTLAEDAGTSGIGLNLDIPAVHEVTVPFTLSGTAVKGTGLDYTTTANGSITIPAGADAASIPITLFDDSLNEASETIILTLDTPTNAILGINKVHTITITDNDTAPTVSVSNVSASEGAGSMNFTVNLSAASGRDVTVNYQVSADTAKEGDDYSINAASGQVTIPAGQTSASVSINLVSDTLDENDETVKIELSSPANATLDSSASMASGTIQDDDGPPSLSINDIMVAESAGSATFAISLSATSGKEITVQYATSDDSATAPADYTSKSGTLTIPAGSNSGVIQFTVINDDLYELDEKVKLSLTNPLNATLAQTNAFATITGKPSISDSNKYTWSSSGGWINWKPTDKSSAVFCSSHLGGYIWSAAYGWISLGDGMPESGSRYANDSASDFGVNHDGKGALTGSAWGSTIGWIQFEQGEGKPKIDLSTGKLSGYAWSTTTGWINLGTNTNHTVQFIHEDAPPSFSINDVTISENVGTASITITKSGSPTALNASVDFSTNAGSATEGSDFVGSSQTITFTPAETTKTVNVTIKEDTIDEPDESFTTKLSNAVHAYISDSEGTISITDNDDPVSFSITGNTANEGSGSIEFTVSLTGETSQNTSVNYATQPGTADSNDFDSTTGTLVFEAGEKSKKITVLIANDSRDEDNQSFTLSLSDPNNALISSGTATGTIEDDDSEPTLTIDNPLVTEDSGNIPFTLTLSAPSEKTIGLSYTTTNGTAVSPADFTGGTFTKSITPGMQSDTINITLIADRLFEPEEQFTITLSNPSNVTLGAEQAIGKILPASNISDTKKNSWSSSTGWTNWKPGNQAGARVARSALGGIIWSSTTGWISLGDGTPENGISYSNTTASDFGINRDANGWLSGNAWSAATGWITFEQTLGKPKVDATTGRFSGFAWSPTLGWINLGLDYLAVSSIDIIDKDGDNMDDAWEIEHFDNIEASNGNEDSDQDGVKDKDEYFSGTSPQKPNDFLKINTFKKQADQGPAATEFTFTFPTNPEFTYRIESSTNLVDWQDSGLGSFASSQGATTTKELVIQNQTKFMFFRVVAVSTFGR